jgi:ferredoxin-NADP reductase/Na+-translocating ferredoxin:NAD+ oxidoreductase RnfD subunit
MYRLVLYYLIALLIIAGLFSAAGMLPYNYWEIIFSALFLVAVSQLINKIFAKTFLAQANAESAYITAFILALIITPAKSLDGYVFLFWAAVLAMASKYILALYKKHIFNPVALAVAVTALTLNYSASWWVGTAVMLPYVCLGGILIVRKIKRADMVFAFLFTALLATFALGIYLGKDLYILGKQAVLGSPLLFFSFIMITEPLTTPPTKNRQIIYGSLVGLLFSPFIHIGQIFFSPELALLAGNVYSYLASPKKKLMLTLKEKIKLGPGLYDFIFASKHKLAFASGQYLEWTLGHSPADSRGNRRYFTLASSPTEKEIVMGVKFYNPASSFKKHLFGMRPGQNILAGQLAGDFTLPKDPSQKLVFIAGGIGITPFRSMVKYLIDKNQKRDIIIFYANKNPDEIIYKDIFGQAEQKLGIKTVYCVSKTAAVPQDFTGQVGRIDEQLIKSRVSDYQNRMFYISGPRSMITDFEQTLIRLGLPKKHIKTDFFPGFA